MKKIFCLFLLALIVLLIPCYLYYLDQLPKPKTNEQIAIEYTEFMNQHITGVTWTENTNETSYICYLEEYPTLFTEINYEEAYQILIAKDGPKLLTNSASHLAYSRMMYEFIYPFIESKLPENTDIVLSVQHSSYFIQPASYTDNEALLDALTPNTNKFVPITFNVQFLVNTDSDLKELNQEILDYISDFLDSEDIQQYKITITSAATDEINSYTGLQFDKAQYRFYQQFDLNRVETRPFDYEAYPTKWDTFEGKEYLDVLNEIAYPLTVSEHEMNDEYIHLSSYLRSFYYNYKSKIYRFSYTSYLSDDQTASNSMHVSVSYNGTELLCSGTLYDAERKEICTIDYNPQNTEIKTSTHISLEDRMHKWVLDEFYYAANVAQQHYPIFIAWNNEIEQVNQHGKDLHDIINARDFLPAAE